MNKSRLFATLAIMALPGCRVSPAPAAAPAPDQRPLPDIPVYELSPVSDSAGARITLSRAGDPLAALTSAKRFTLTSNGADARTLLLWLAQEAGLNLVVSQDVNARVSVSFTDVPAVDAIRTVMAVAGLSVLTSPARAPGPPVVFYRLPINVNEATAEVIAARFGVSLEMARFIVESRNRP
jgi:hypothetical protein